MTTMQLGRLKLLPEFRSNRPRHMVPFTSQVMLESS